MARIISFKTKPVILGTGLICLDVVVSSDPKQPVYYWTGGTCGNVLTILSFLGWRAFPVARLNGDAASLRVKEDMSSWGVKLAFAEQTPTADTPIIAQQNTYDKKGNPIHKFKWTCPKCGAWLPNYRPITIIPAQAVASKIENPRVFFFDRVSPGALILAKKCKELGAVIYFEPSAKGDPKYFLEALKLAHIVKYSKERFSSLVHEFNLRKAPLLEIQTVGRDGLLYRSNCPKTKLSKWIKLPAVEVENVKDTCGCGDWATAGIISKLCAKDGVAELESKSLEEITAALNYGQALAAWNCGFEGARGGMYQVNKRSFDKDISDIIEQGFMKIKVTTKKLNSDGFKKTICPACVNK